MSGPQVLHIIPEDGVGGVEIAARSAIGDDVRLFFVADHNGRGLLRPSTYLGLLSQVNDQKTQIAVFSLWRSVFAFLTLLLFRPSIKRVLFLHSDRDVHVVDRLATAFMARSAHAVFADSNTSLTRLGPRANKPKRVVSFVLNKRAPLPRRASPVFAYWGRLTALKNIPRALSLFADILKSHADARFVLIGPKGNAVETVETTIATLGLEEAVDVVGYLPTDEIPEATHSAAFYVQLSDQEGMAMSVVEAMQMGLVPIVTPVGEMGAYVQHGKNGLIFNSVEITSGEINAILKDAPRFQKMSNAACQTWANAPLYRDDFRKAIQELSQCAG